MRIPSPATDHRAWLDFPLAVVTCALIVLGCGAGAVNPSSDSPGAAGPTNGTDVAPDAATTVVSPAPAICAGAPCADPCAVASETSCGGQCVDLESDAANCRHCGNVCVLPSAVNACGAGACRVASCRSGFADCDHQAPNGCEVDLNNDTGNCGACGSACPFGMNCLSGRCAGGETTTPPSCAAGHADCDGNRRNGCETDLTSDINHCSACDTACGAPPHVNAANCTGGACTIAYCAPGWTDCDGQFANGCEVNLAADPKNCGECGLACAAGANAMGSTCVAGACRIVGCTSGHEDCDGNPANGCETDITSDTANCGGCGAGCARPAHADTVACNGGRCLLTSCSYGYADCDHNDGNGCEAALNPAIPSCTCSTLANCGPTTTCSFNQHVSNHACVACVGGARAAGDDPSGPDTVCSPVISSISPTLGPSSGGTSVTITGLNFIGASAVTFGGTPAASFVVNSATQITATSPAVAAGVVDVVVSNSAGSSATSNADQFTFGDAPAITSLSPTAGSTSGGTSVTIGGTGFTTATAVNFGSTSAASFTVNSDTSITAATPASSTGTVDVTVTSAYGTSATSSADQFTYQVAIIFVTTSTYQGNLGGFAGADAKCNADAAKPAAGFAAGYTYKALLNANNATTNGVTYYRPDGTTLIATATGGNLVGSNSLNNAVSAANVLVWTGFRTAAGCVTWTSSALGVNTGSYGQSDLSTSQWWGRAINASCNLNSLHLYCVSQ